jgi:pimeloyl-ACP methyl ester carboxylesterase
MTTPSQVDPPRVPMPPQPATTYAEALAKLEALQAIDGAYVKSACVSYALLHGQRTPKTIVLLHGITNCPRQFVEFAPLFFDQGYNVLIPRMPRNGYRDSATKDVARLTSGELRAYGDAAVDIAAGLGEQVAIFGLSAGGTVGAWVAQTRPEVSRAVIAAPFLGLLGQAGPALSVPVGNGFVGATLRAVPNMTLAFPEPLDHGYTGFQTRSLGQVLALGSDVLHHAAQAKPAAGSSQIVFSQADASVNQYLTLELARRWMAHGAATDVYEFPRSAGVPHDLIDPAQKNQMTTQVYPLLQEMILR